MRVAVLGSSGLLGQVTTRALMTAGHHVLGVTRTGRSMPEQAGPRWAAHPLDVVCATDDELRSLLVGVDAVVHALGPDDRERPPAPAREHFQRLLVDPTLRVARAAADTEVCRMVILGSYFSTFHRLEPERQLASRHAYIAAREDQSRGSLAVARPGFDVSVLEIPFVFGAMPGVVPMWRAVLFDLLRRSPIAAVPAGGSAAVTADQVGVAVTALIHGEARGRLPIATDNVSFAHLAATVLDESGSRRSILRLPAAILGLGLRMEKVRLRVRGLESGLDPVHLAELLSRDLFLDTTAGSAPFGLTPGSVDEAIRETVRAAYPN